MAPPPRHPERPAPRGLFYLIGTWLTPIYSIYILHPHRPPTPHKDTPMPRTKSNLVKHNMYLDPQVVQALKWVAARRGTNLSELVRQALREYALETLVKERAVAESLPELVENDT